MPDVQPDLEPTLVERWLQEQQEWQKTLLAYFDSMVKNDEFLVHLGNAMRGSLLAGKPYPAAGAGTAAGAADDRLDQVLHALNTLQGQVQDLAMSLDELRLRDGGTAAPPATARAVAGKPTTRPAAAKRAAKPAARAKRRARG